MIVNKPIHYYEIDTPLIAADGWPLTLINFVLSREVEEHKLLRGTGIFCEDIAKKQLLLTPMQSLQLIRNSEKYLHQHDLPFLLGQEYFASADNAASLNLQRANNLQAAIDCLVANQAQLTPLLNLRCHYEQDRLVIYWQDACGAESNTIFLAEMMSTAVSSLSRWRSGDQLPWQFYFSHAKPQYIEQYEVHLNHQVQFSCHANAMAIARDYLHRPWPARSDTTIQHSKEATSDCIVLKGFLTAVYDYLQQHIRDNPGLDATAAAFGMSSASFKRKLKKHQSHFQEQYDQVRKDLAVYWLNESSWSKEQVAKALHFYDVGNLRRAFKKWTGKLLPAKEKPI
jgi:AraC-like DNA-binding protein